MKSDMEKFEDRERFRKLLAELRDPGHSVAPLPWATGKMPGHDGEFHDAHIIDASGNHIADTIMKVATTPSGTATGTYWSAYFEPPIAEFILRAVEIATEAVEGRNPQDLLKDWVRKWQFNPPIMEDFNRCFPNAKGMYEDRNKTTEAVEGK